MPAPNSACFSRYYADIRQSPPVSYQEMNSTLAELSGVRHGPGALPSVSWGNSLAEQGESLGA